MTKEEYYKDNEMYKYLKEHAYISYNKKSNYQFELAVDRAQCIANKYHNLTKELEQENKQLKEELENDIDRYEDTISYQLGFDKGKEYLQQIIDNAKEYIKNILKWVRLQKDWETEKILLNLLILLGDKENE